MQQWAYQSLHFNGAEIWLLQYSASGTHPQPIQPDLLIDTNLTNTLRRWIAQLGTEGWELMGILTDETGQELIFKRPN